MIAGKTNWEVDWTWPLNTGTVVRARNRRSHLATAREWHPVPTGYLRMKGVSTPRYRTDSWEIDWSRRKGKLVWARNEASKTPSARAWHWIDYHTAQRSGFVWRPVSPVTGRWLNSQGYVCLSRRGMSQFDVEFAETHGLFKGRKRNFVREHQVVAAKKLGGPLPKGTVVRHLNGVKDDNRPENLVIGTTQENTMDHNQARLMAMYWRGKFEELSRQAR